MRHVLTFTFIAVVGCASAAAQTTGEQILLERTAAAQAEVVVRADGGGSIRGRLVGLVDDELELATRGGPRWIRLPRVVRVTQPGDSIVDGVLRGMGTATTLCILTCERTADGSVRAGGFLGRLAIGGAIGGLLDRAHNGRRTIYQRRPPPTIHIGASPRGGSVTIEF
jgi:hypothetical protein